MMTFKSNHIAKSSFQQFMDLDYINNQDQDTYKMINLQRKEKNEN